MPFQITVKAGHVSDSFRRGGQTFRKDSPTVLDSLNEALEQERALGDQSALRFEEVAAEEARQSIAEQIIEVLGSKTAEDAKADLTTKRVGELRDLAQLVGVEVPEGADKKTLVEALRARL